MGSRSHLNILIQILHVELSQVISKINILLTEKTKAFPYDLFEDLQNSNLTVDTSESTSFARH